MVGHLSYERCCRVDPPSVIKFNINKIQAIVKRQKSAREENCTALYVCTKETAQKNC